MRQRPAMSAPPSVKFDAQFSAPQMQACLDLARENAPYIAQLLSEHEDVPAALLGADAERVLKQCLSQIDAIFSQTDQAARRESKEELDSDSDGSELDSPVQYQVMEDLRRYKRRAHLIIALCDLARLWGWEEVTTAMTQLADSCVRAALSFAAFEQNIYHSAQNPVPGLFVLALGKYGAFELNYSSDIDIIVLYDMDALQIGDKLPEKTMIRVTQKFVHLLDYLNGDGYVFRTDLRLRPDPRSNAICVSTAMATRYYETLGQNWERAAMIKARLCAGDAICSAQFEADVLGPFIWRRNLDFTAIDDIQAMKRQILAHGKHGKICAAGHHLKLGRGGIREVEFYAQTQQLILGGRHEELHLKRTDEALSMLSQMGYVAQEVADSLLGAYGVLRDLEHRVQLIDDAQTHIAPKEDEARLALARLSGFDDLDGFDAHLISVLHRVHKLYSALFPEKDSLALKEGNLAFTGVEPEPGTLETFHALGYERGEQIWREMAGWLGGRVAATRTERARISLTRLAPRIIKACAQTGLPDTAFFQFADFFTQLRGGASLLALFDSQPKFMSSIIDIMAQAPKLAGQLARQPATIDAMIEPDFYALDEAALARDYAQLGDEDSADLEDIMNMMRRHVREDHFRICTALLTGKLSTQNAPPIFTSIAQNAAARLVPFVHRDVQRRLPHPGGEFAIIALGKMGGREMALSSDLDIMTIYLPSEEHPLDGHRYFAKLTQRLISALSVATAEGGMFDVDMALRPSGGAGPITVSLKAFDGYYDDKAWTWEFMALSRARIIYASSPDFETVLQQRIKSQLTRARERSKIREDVHDMRLRLLRDKGPRGEWDIKRVRGAMTDIEFCVQYLQLISAHDRPDCLSSSTPLAIKNLMDLSILAPDDGLALLGALELFTAMRQYLAIAIEGVFDPESAPDIVRRGLAIICEQPDFASLERRYQETLLKVSQIYDTYVGQA